MNRANVSHPSAEDGKTPQGLQMNKQRPEQKIFFEKIIPVNTVNTVI